MEERLRNIPESDGRMVCGGGPVKTQRKKSPSAYGSVAKCCGMVKIGLVVVVVVYHVLLWYSCGFPCYPG